MPSVILSASVPVELWVLFEEKMAGKSFSKWVQDHMARELKYKQNKRLVPDKGNKKRCTNSPRYKGIQLKPEMCRVCGVAECDDRLD